MREFGYSIVTLDLVDSFSMRVDACFAIYYLLVGRMSLQPDCDYNYMFRARCCARNASLAFQDHQTHQLRTFFGLQRQLSMLSTTIHCTPSRKE